jgi:hypothetical protein
MQSLTVGILLDEPFYPERDIQTRMFLHWQDGFEMICAKKSNPENNHGTINLLRLVQRSSSA